MEPYRVRLPRTGELQFELTGGALCLDFANTLNGRFTSTPNDQLRDYSDIVAWSRQTGVISDARARQLVRAAPRNPAKAASLLGQAIETREAIFATFSAVAEGRPAPAAALAVFNKALSKNLSHSEIVRDGNSFVWGFNGGEPSLDETLWAVTRSAAELLTSPEIYRVRECAAETCAWLFLDGSRNGSRRWCDMKVCGNRAKIRRFRKSHGTAH